MRDVIIMANPTKTVRKKFDDIKNDNPERASRIASRKSGEIFGLYPTPDGYFSDTVITVVFEEGKYRYGLE